MRYAILLLLTLLASLTFNHAQADPPRAELNCSDGGLAAHPNFTQVSPGRAEYIFSGACIAHDGRSFAYRVGGTWTPSETNPANANASETWRIDMLSGPSRSFDVIMGAHCTADPWLNNAQCARLGDNVPIELRALWPGLVGSTFPRSRYGIREDQRVSLRAEYARANTKWQSVPPATERIQIRERHVGTAGVRQAGGVNQTIGKVALNPQPLPPGPDAEITQPAQSGAFNPAANENKRALNPQPLPPGPDSGRMQRVQGAQADRGAETGIIIVSGNPAPQLGLPAAKKKLNPAADAMAPERAAETSPQH